MKNKRIVAIIGTFISVIIFNLTLIVDYSSDRFSLSDLIRNSLADGEGTEITVDCSDNISGPGSTVFRECEEDCPKKTGTLGPKNGTCTYWE